MPAQERRRYRPLVRCPLCQWPGGMYRSRMRWWERPLRFVSPRRPYRCHLCDQRFWLGPWRERRTPRPRLRGLAQRLALQRERLDEIQLDGDW